MFNAQATFRAYTMPKLQYPVEYLRHSLKQWETLKPYLLLMLSEAALSSMVTAVAGLQKCMGHTAQTFHESQNGDCRLINVD